MGLKSFTNTPDGRIFFTMTALVVLALGLSGGMVAWAVGALSPDKGSLENQLKAEANAWPIRELAMIPETEPLPELPSTTLTYKANESDGDSKANISNHPVGFAYEKLHNRSLESLVNTSVSYTGEGKKGETSYDFKFYASSLNDYKEEGDYLKAAEQFFELDALNLSSISFVSQPSPSGGRELNVNVTQTSNMTSTEARSSEQLWKDLLSRLTDSEVFPEGDLLKLSLSDGGKVTITTTVASKDDIANASSIYPGLWTTFSAYAYGTPYEWLKTSKVTYNAERTNEDSTLILTVDKDIPATKDLRKRLIEPSIESNGEIVVIWSYNTYLVTEDNKTPFLTISSSSMNW